MGLFGGSSSASSSSTNHSSVWDIDQIENEIQNLNTNINYTPESLLDLNPYLQQFLDYETSGQAFNTAKNVISEGGQIFSQGLNRLEKAGSMTPQGIYDALYQGVKAVNSSMQGYVNNQDQAIENKVMVTMGDNLAQNATMQNAGGAVAGSSAMNNSAMGIQEAGAESMEEQESQLAMKVLRGSASVVNNVAGNYAHIQNGVTNSLLGIGSNIIKGGVKANNNAMSDFYNAALFEQAYSQKGANVDRKNAMIIADLPIMEQQYLIQQLLQAGGADTTSTTSGSSSMSSGGIL